MTKYCIDLAKNQKDNGHTVFLLWPGKIQNKFSLIKRTIEPSLYSVEIRSKYLIPLTFGVLHPNKFFNLYSCDVFDSFLNDNKIDLLIIHTLMGSSKELIESSNKKRIKTVFVTHDYYGLCPKVNGYFENKNCNFESCERCIKCNSNAISEKKIKLMQSPLYRKFKGNYLVKKIRQRIKYNTNIERTDNIKSGINQNGEVNYEIVKVFDEMKNYYLDALHKVDIILCNSPLSYNIYSQFVNKSKCLFFPITHKDIQDNRSRKQISNTLKILYVGPENIQKGFFELIKSLDNLFIDFQFDLYVYGPDNFVNRVYLHFMGKFDYQDMNSVYKQYDLLVVPSLWRETFGFIVLEGLSNGIPVLCSQNVGSKYLVSNNMCYEDLTKTLKEILENTEILTIEQTRICEQDLNIYFDFNENCNLLIKEVMGEKCNYCRSPL